MKARGHTFRTLSRFYADSSLNRCRRVEVRSQATRNGGPAVVAGRQGARAPAVRSQRRDIHPQARRLTQGVLSLRGEPPCSPRRAGAARVAGPAAVGGACPGRTPAHGARTQEEVRVVTAEVSAWLTGIIGCGGRRPPRCPPAAFSEARRPTAQRTLATASSSVMRFARAWYCATHADPHTANDSTLVAAQALCALVKHVDPSRNLQYNEKARGRPAPTHAPRLTAAAAGQTSLLPRARERDGEQMPLRLLPRPALGPLSARLRACALHVRSAALHRRRAVDGCAQDQADRGGGRHAEAQHAPGVSPSTPARHARCV